MHTRIWVCTGIYVIPHNGNGGISWDTRVGWYIDISWKYHSSEIRILQIIHVSKDFPLIKNQPFLGSPHLWKPPYHVLLNGKKY